MKQKSFTYQKEQPWPFVLGVDLSSTSIKYMLLRRRGSSFLIEAYGRFAISDQEYDLSAKVDEIFSSVLPKNLRKKAKIVAGFDSPQLIIKKESFPKMPAKDMQEAVRLGLSQQVEGEIGGGSVICDCTAVGPDIDTPGNTQYVVLGLPEAEVYNRLLSFTSNHIIPHKAIPSIVSLSNLLDFLPEEQRTGSTAILDIGAEHSVLVFFKDGLVDFFREIAVGGDDFTKSVTGTIFHEGRAIQFSSDEAVEFKQRYGYPLGFSDGMTFRGAPLTEVGAMMRPVVERLSGEIHRSFVFYKENSGGTDVSSLYLAGGGARLKHLSEVLAENLSIPVSTFPMPDNIKVAGGEENQKRFEQKFLEQAVCLSVALESSAERNLLPEPFEKIHKNAAVQKIMAYAAGGLMIVLLLISNSVKNHNVKLGRNVAEIEARIRKAPSRGDEFARLKKRQALLSGQLNDLITKSSQDSTVIDILRLVSNIIPDHLKLIYMDFGKEAVKPQASRRVRAAKKKNAETEKPKTVLKMAGWTKNPPNDAGIYLAKFVVELEKSGFFSEVTVGHEETSEEDKSYMFEISAYLKE
ncbi:pilus assembly protein PilM [bacterium]|nr:pilus assembly protein PilM [bacterium]